MPIYEMLPDKLSRIETSFAVEKIYERDDIQRLLRDQIEVISPDTLIIAEEFNNWEDSNRRIDLLGIDNKGQLVVIELKRTMSGGHMDLQVLRYAAMISSMTPEQIYETYADYLKKKGNTDLNAEEEINNFILKEYSGEIGNGVQIILASAEFDKEITTTVLWLNENGLSIKCFRLKPYKVGEKILLEIQQVIPLPEAEEYTITIRKKSDQQKRIKESERDYRRFDLHIGATVFNNLAKRNLLYQVVREAVNRNNAPEEIGESIDWRKIFFSVEGEFKTEDDFINNALTTNNKFDQRRFFTKDDELILHNGKTYSLTNQWGRRTEEAVDNIIKNFSLNDVKYQETN